MKLFIMTELEGVAGVINGSDWLYPTGRYYETARYPD
jgi:D-aminopeptidase